MMRRYGSPYVVVAAVVAALQHAGCATEDGGAIPEQELDTSEVDRSPGDDGDDHPGDDGSDDGDDHPGDDGGDDDDGGDGGGDDGGDGGDTCPADPCEGQRDDGLFVVSECSTMYPFETSIELTCAGALARCQELAQEDPGRSIVCEYGHSDFVELFRYEAFPEFEECDVFGPACEPGEPTCQIPCGDDQPGTYDGFYCGPDGQPFIHTEGITCQAALGNCALDAALSPDKDIVCEFNGLEIFRREVNEGTCVAEHGEPTLDCDLPVPELCEGSHPCLSGGTGRYKGSFCDGNFFIRTPGIDCQAALGNCILNASLVPTRSIRCEWDRQEIYRNEVEEGVCEEFGPTCDLPAP